MKRSIAFLVVAIVSLMLSASPSYGYSVAPYGEVSENPHLGLEARGTLGFTSFHHRGDLSVSVRIGSGDKFFKQVGAAVSTPLYETGRHPFNRFFINTTLWEPTLRLGVEWNGDDLRYVSSLSPLCFVTRKYAYEMFSPYVFTGDFSSYGWGITVFKVTAFLGGGR